MKADPAQKILDKLLDKYEASTFFREDRTPTRRFLLKLYDRGVTEFPSYDIEDSDGRITINRAVERLAARGIIGFDWMPGETGHILARVWLRPEAIGEAYQAAGRRPKRDLMAEVTGELEELKGELSLDWARAWCQEMLWKMGASGNVPALIPLNPTERALLYRTLQGLEDEAGRGITARVFSVKYLEDSKAFENTVRPRLLSILRQFIERDDDTRDDELLQRIGILRYPEQFEFRGRVVFEGPDGRTDFRALRSGASISAGDVSVGNLKIDPSVTAILTIENRANYFETLERHRDEGEIVLYHGGQYSPAKKVFFQALHQAMPEHCIWRHWGDLDFGGFSMLARLRREIDPAILPYRMDLSEVKAHRDHCTGISGRYAERLLELSRQPELADAKEVLEYLAEERIRLEQEVLLLT